MQLEVESLYPPPRLFSFFLSFNFLTVVIKIVLVQSYFVVVFFHKTQCFIHALHGFVNLASWYKLSLLFFSPYGVLFTFKHDVIKLFLEFDVAPIQRTL